MSVDSVYFFQNYLKNTRLIKLLALLRYPLLNGMLQRELHLKFLASLPALTKTMLEYAMMSHLRTSVLYWTLTAESLLGCTSDSFSVNTEEVLSYLQSVYRPECGGFAGDIGHDAHLLFTLSALQVFKILKCEYPGWFDARKCVDCKEMLVVGVVGDGALVLTSFLFQTF